MRNALLIFVVLGFFACQSNNELPGDQLFEKGQYQQALAAYNDYLESNQATPSVLFNRGRCYEELKQWDLAIADFEQVIKIDQQNASAHVGIATVKYEEKKYQQSLLQAGKALELNDNFAEAHFIAARAKHQLGYVDGAFDSYTQALVINREYGEAFLYRGALKISMKQTRSACEDLLKARNLKIPGAQDALNKYCK